MSEATATCRIHDKYEEIECSNPAYDVEGFCILHSQEKAKDPEAFKTALRARWNQQDTEFYDFRLVFFPVPFDPKDFFGSREFSKPVDFSGATFTEGAVFSWATFTEKANFAGATFMKEAYFVDATFRKEANFLTVTIRGRAVLLDLNPPQAGVPSPPAFRADFQYLHFSPEAMLRFQDLSLAYCTFNASDLRRVEFHHVQWHPYRGRQAVYDEVLLRQEEKKKPWFWAWLLYDDPHADPPSSWTDKYGEVERLYRDLQENYERARDYKRMGDFYYGEMEMHRRASKWRWLPIYWYNLYRFLSGYGERPLRALLVLAGLLVVFTWGFSGAEGNLTPAWSWGRFWEDCLYILQKATFQRPERQLLTNWGQWLATLSPLLLPGQAALFILALRNRLGRRR